MAYTGQTERLDKDDSGFSVKIDSDGHTYYAYISSAQFGDVKDALLQNTGVFLHCEKFGGHILLAAGHNHVIQLRDWDGS